MQIEAAALCHPIPPHLPPPQGDTTGDDAEISPYLLRPQRKLFDACREAGRDHCGRRCPRCPVKALCDAGRLR